MGDHTCENCYNNDGGLCEVLGHAIEAGDPACEDWEGDDDEGRIS